MKITFFDKVVFEGPKEEGKAFIQSILDNLDRLEEEIKDTYPMKATDTDETYYESLQFLNPFIYDTLNRYRDLAGEYFKEFHFYRMNLQGFNLRVYANPEKTKTKMISFGHIYLAILFDLPRQTFWKVE